MPLQELNEPQEEKKKNIFFVKVVGCCHGLMQKKKCRIYTYCFIAK